MSQSESVDREPSGTEDSDGEVTVDSNQETNPNEDRNSQPQTREEYEERLESLREERDELKEKYLRKVADLDNLRKRKEEEKQRHQKYANKNLLKDLLEVIDNFDRALDSMEFESGEVEDGIRMIRKQLDELLDKYHVEKIDAEDEPFDPNYHEGMMQEEQDHLEQRTVLEVFQDGYKLHDQVLRPAQVKVGVPESAGETEDQETS